MIIMCLDSSHKSFDARTSIITQLFCSLSLAPGCFATKSPLASKTASTFCLVLGIQGSNNPTFVKVSKALIANVYIQSFVKKTENRLSPATNHCVHTNRISHLLGHVLHSIWLLS